MTALLTDEEIIPVARTHGENVSSVKSDQNAAIHDFTAGARFARDHYEARLAEAIALMKEAAPAIDTISFALSERFDRFLAIYTKEGKP